MTLIAEIEDVIKAAVLQLLPIGSAVYHSREPYKKSGEITALVAYRGSEYNGSGCNALRTMSFLIEFKARTDIHLVMENIRVSLNEKMIDVPSDNQSLELLIKSDALERDADGIEVGQQTYELAIIG